MQLTNWESSLCLWLLKQRKSLPKAESSREIVENGRRHELDHDHEHEVHDHDHDQEHALIRLKLTSGISAAATRQTTVNANSAIIAVVGYMNG